MSRKNIDKPLAPYTYPNPWIFVSGISQLAVKLVIKPLSFRVAPGVQSEPYFWYLILILHLTLSAGVAPLFTESKIFPLATAQSVTWG